MQAEREVMIVPLTWGCLLRRVCTLKKHIMLSGMQVARTRGDVLLYGRVPHGTGQQPIGLMRIRSFYTDSARRGVRAVQAAQHRECNV